MKMKPLPHPTIRDWLSHLHRQGKSKLTVAAYRRGVCNFAQWCQDSYGEPFDPAAVIPRRAGVEIAPTIFGKSSTEHGEPAYGGPFPLFPVGDGAGAGSLSPYCRCREPSSTCPLASGTFTPEVKWSSRQITYLSFRRCCSGSDGQNQLGILARGPLSLRARPRARVSDRPKKGPGPLAPPPGFGLPLR
jgi:hypothetical protein